MWHGHHGCFFTSIGSAQLPTFLPIRVAMSSVGRSFPCAEDRERRIGRGETWRSSPDQVRLYPTTERTMQHATLLPC